MSRVSRRTDFGAEQFYDCFADKYDVMVSGERYDRDLPFFENVIRRHNAKSVLDCACGTGKLVARLALAGFDAVGSDISAEMIRAARRNAQELGAMTTFIQADFKRLSQAFDRKFDCVICWGNALPHELEERNVLSALRSTYSILNDGGTVIIQIRNLSKWLREGRRIFPIHYHKEPNGDRKAFIYVLDFRRTRVRFNVISLIEIGGKPKFEVDSVDYRIISAEQLKTMMAEVGFRRLDVFADTNYARFSDRDSEGIIVVGSK